MTAASIVRPPGRERLLVRLPYRSGAFTNYDLLRRICGDRTRAEWDAEVKAYRVARTHLYALIDALAHRFGEVVVTLQTRRTTRCVEACWEANGGTWFDCECSCLGRFHGRHSPPPDSFVTAEEHSGGEVRRTLTAKMHSRSLIVRPDAD
ncbi:hypothetical protein GCM10009616_11340 [Microlunatus lacustris]